MTTASEPRWRRLEPDQRREQIFICAARLFGERPYAGVSTSDIAAEAGVARGLINHYFGTKRELYLAVIRRAVTMPMPDMEVGGGSLYERAHTTVDWFLDMVHSQGKMWLVATSEGIGQDQEVEQIIVDAERKSAERLLDAFGMPAESDIRPRLNALVRAFAGMVKAAGREWLLRGELDRTQVHVLLYQTLITLLEDVFPEVLTRPPHAEN
ncbi:TetR/AcrR family transcriptional regulator [Amycolatopsis acidiphila]|uniref:TetR/AcrR family transcriptional regulator n=1 Tax=Amycolatopsis acidiphila TaxID=715473 RepID=A0A557ZYD9_9PSEU|nr:TetR/AcrR family transcriptional regulator [Amycolatopsis acidiphila]TVT17026.1 TetR/AcrR family transcriptional regulator [Amycolatopsis acidiphila]UIJ58567.1 TetR/AcrR family transcriptional regulator [Amycolatopsis acidiphila]GHG76808.1 TetR family transcriptional regulator [Amycolatopsis acidiphila]